MLGLFAVATWVAPVIMAGGAVVAAVLIYLAFFDRSDDTLDDREGFDSLSDRLGRGEIEVEEFERRKLATR